MAGSDPFDIVNPDGKASALVLCDHASNAMPPRYKNLGLDAAVVAQHIGWDIGAAGVARRLSVALGATAILARWSRLLIDVNRDPKDPTSIPAVSDGVEVPGNRNLPLAERQARIARYFTPYHRWIDEKLAWFRKRTVVPSLIAIHSFTPQLQSGEPRHWHAGVLWDKDPRLALPVLNALRPMPGIEVGDNEPYSARIPTGYTMAHHGHRTGLPHLSIEIRQDEIESEAGQAEWAERLARALKPLLAKPYKIQVYQ